MHNEISTYLAVMVISNINFCVIPSFDTLHLLCAYLVNTRLLLFPICQLNQLDLYQHTSLHPNLIIILYCTETLNPI